MNKACLWAIAGVLALGFGAAEAQDEGQPQMTVDGAKAALTEIPGIDRCEDPGSAPSTTGVPDVGAMSKEEFETQIRPYTSYINTANAYVECLRVVEQTARENGALTEVQQQAFTIVDNDTWTSMDALVQLVQPAIAAYKEMYPNG